MGRSTKMRGSLEKTFILCMLIATFPFISMQVASDSYSEKMQQAKAKLLQTIQKETSELSGFDEFATVPITFPIDICLMEVANRLYAACLSLEYHGGKNVTVFSILAHGPKNPDNPLFDYELIFRYETRAAQSMDCVSMGTEGYIAVVNNIDRVAYNDINEGSPIFQLKNNTVTPVQFFTKPGQARVQLLNVHNTMFMIQTFRSGANNEKSLCPILKWIDSTFNVFDYLPCMNAARIEPFIIDHHIYVAVANHMDQYQNVETYSTIYRYDMDVHKFNQTQIIKTFGAIDVKHFQIASNAITEHFLIFANLFDANKQKDSSIASNGVVYRYEHGKFAPIQVLNFETAVQQFLPVLTENKEFVLLVSMDGEAIKTYQFDGWTFSETAISFSGGAFGKGISTMRTFNIKKKYAIVVVANRGMYKDAVNLFRPKFVVKMDYDFAKAFEMFDSWYNATKDKLHSDGIVELFEQVENVRVPHGFDVVNLENVNVNKIQADTMTGSSLPIDVKKFKQVVQDADELVAKGLVRRSKRLNDSFDPNVTDVMNVPLSMTANEITIGDSLIVKSINSHQIDTLLRLHTDVVLDKLIVENLVISNNEENFHAIEAKLNESRVRHKRDDSVQTVNLGNVFVDGLVNGIKIEYLFKNALLMNAPTQRIDADIKCGLVNTTTVSIPSNHISNVNLGMLARISGDHVAVYPPIQFAQSIEVEKLEVLHRVNQILIKNKKMDVLFKRFGKQTQVITGQKVFQRVDLREPISLQGAIKVSSPILDRIKPIATINEDLVIDFPVVFNGNATVLEALSAANIFSPSLRYSVALLHSDGLRLTDQLVPMHITFEQPIRASDVRSQTRLNNILVDDLVKCDPNTTEVILGRKTFTSDLSLGNGISEINQINGIKLQTLNETMMKRSSDMQAFNGTITFKRIVADRVNADKFVVGKTPLQQLLTRNTDQRINGTVTVHGNVFVSSGSNLALNHLSMRNRMFDVNLQELLDDCYRSKPNESVHIGADKWFRNLTVHQLIVENDFWHQNTSTEVMHARVQSLLKSITVTGPQTYSTQFDIDELVVNGMINGIPSSEFRSKWLLTTGNQEFSASQNFASMEFGSNINVNGRINGLDIEHLVSQSIPLSSNETIHLSHVVFENVTFESPIELEGTLSGIQIPDDLILTESNALQSFLEPLSLAANVTIHGTLTIAESLNNRDVKRMCGLLHPNEQSDYRLHVEGNVNFLKEPTAMHLNGISFEQLRDTTWFVDDPAVQFKYATHFKDVVWRNAITVTGRVNNVHLEEINAKYLSLSKSQQITAPISFKGSVHFAETVNVSAITLDGLLKEFESGLSMNITHFYVNVLKHTDEIQFVRAPWTIHELRPLGNIKVNTLNNLRLSSDIVRWDRPNENIIRAAKRFGAINIERLYCQDNCLVQGIDIAKWIASSVLNPIDYSINGRVHLHNAVISQMIAVGPVNGVKFNSKTVLLSHTPQRIDGSVIIGKPEQLDTLTPLTFNDMRVSFVNDRNFSEFHANLIRRSHRNRISTEIFTDIQMLSSLSVDNLTNRFLMNSSHVMPSGNQLQDQLAPIPT